MRPSRTIRLGLTGGIGSGKSTAAKLLAQLGAHLIDADHISRQLTASGGKAIAAIRAAFGDTYIASDGSMDRAQMRQLVFHDASAKSKLETIMHPLIYLETDLQAEQAQTAGQSVLVFDLPLLVESGRWRARLDHILVIDCAPEIQVQRVVARNGLAPEEVQSIMMQQASRARRLAAADSVIDNSAPDFDHLAAQLELFIGYIS